MAHLAKELLEESSSLRVRHSTTSKAKTNTNVVEKTVRCLVYWIDEQLVSIVKRTAIQLPDVTAAKEGEIHRVKYHHNKKMYDAKVLKISDDLNILKEMEKNVAEGLAMALEDFEPTTTDEPTTTEPTTLEKEPTPTRGDQKKDGTRQEKGKKDVNAVSKKKRPPGKQSEKSKEQKVDQGPLSQVRAKAAAQREVFKTMVTEQAFMALPPQENLAPDCQTSIPAVSAAPLAPAPLAPAPLAPASLAPAPLAPAASYVGDLTDTWPPPHSLPRTSSPLPLTAASCSWGQGQQSYLQELREVSNFANTIMDPVQQDHLLSENRELKARIQSLEAQLQLRTDTSLSASTCACSADTPVLPIVAEKHCQFLEDLASVLRKSRTCSQLNQSSGEEKSDVSVSTISELESMDFNMDNFDVSSDSESEKVTETSESTEEAKVELVAGMGVFVTKTQYSTLMLLSKSKTASQFVRSLLLTLFSPTELKRGSAVGGRVSLKDGQKSRSLPLDAKRMAALKAFVLKRYRTDSCPVALKESEFNRIINCKCGELRAAARKDNSL